MNRLAPALLILAVLAAGCEPSGGESAPAGLSVREAWVRPAPPGAHMTAAYMVIANPGRAPAFLTGVSSPAFGEAEVHATVIIDGVSRMRHQPRVEVPPGGELALAPGGLHVMLMQPLDGMPAEGDVGLVLEFEDGRTLSIEAPVGNRAQP